jgi:hypothetical protein
VNPVSIGHITSLDSPQNGQVIPCGTSFIPLSVPETLNVLWHFVQVTIFSILNSLLLFSPMGSKPWQYSNLSWLGSLASLGCALHDPRLDRNL